MPEKKKICVVTGTRAEYGLLYWIMKEVQDDRMLELQVLVTGMHLSPEFGLTYQQIEKDGFVIDQKVEMLLSSDTSVGISKSIGLGIIGFADAFKRLTPKLIVVLGDRFEIFSAVSAALIAKIPVAHISGGETTEGAYDEAMRHSITKMSHLHFTSTEEYRNRVIQLGEQPDGVFNVGATNIDNIVKLNLLESNELEEILGFKFKKYNLMVTFHPETLGDAASEIQFSNILTALDELGDTHLIFTKANADTEGRIINKMIDDYVGLHKAKASSFVSLGQINYLSVLRCVDGVVGNSSSGLTEAPSFKVGTINIGDRQTGRLKPESVIDCSAVTDSIRQALKELFSPAFKERLQRIVNPYGEGNSCEKIVKIIRGYPLQDILKKTFYDI